MLPRMRTIAEAYKYLQKSDPDTAMNPHAIRKLILTQTIPSVKSGNKYLINLDTLEDYLNLPLPDRNETVKSLKGVYRIDERVYFPQRPQTQTKSKRGG